MATASEPFGGAGAGAGAGGFMHSSALSPAPSTSTVTPSLLPKPRSHPLRAGSIKETTVINHIDKTILSINRRHAKKFSAAFDDDSHQHQQHQQQQAGAPLPASEKGYESFKEVAKDVESLVDVLWVSGTPSLQIPYLISLAVLVNTYLPDYPFAANATFRLLRKLDSVFASLVLGEDSESGVPLSGFEGGRRNVVSMTEKVRIKSIAETSRVTVVEAREQTDGLVEADDDDDDDDEFGLDGHDAFGTEETPGKWEMETAKVYEKTIQLLGDELGQAGEFCDVDMADG
ncbi:hypothetical protein P175DRAFT_0457641, partial [Aspergillus ochraceoroseus IBT 24754]